jgi:polysaccharide pyruvyl transferase WcaK-like protein
VIFYWMSIDIKNPLSKNIIQDIFEKNFKVFVRDEASKNLLQELGIQSKEMWDIVFYDNGDNFSKKSFALQIIPSAYFSEHSIDQKNIKDKVVGIALRQWYFNEAQDEQILIKSIFDTILKAGAKKIVLLPMSFHPSDYQANDYYFLKGFLSEKIVLWGDSIGEIYKNFTEKKIDICIAMRLHAIILSQVYQIPFIALSYSKKTDEILKKLSI